MSPSTSDFTDQQVDRIISDILRTGLIVASLTVLFGAIITLCSRGGEVMHYNHFQAEPDDLRKIPGIVRSAFAYPFDGAAIMQFGILLLLATPLMRVVFSIYAFARQRDKVFVCITAIVLCILVYSIIAGLRS